VPYVQKPFNVHGFERIQKFLNDRLCVGIRSFYCELAHDEHNFKPVFSRLLKNDFFDIFYAKNPMILRVIFSKHGFFNTLLDLLENATHLLCVGA
jgi:hypothetical protein